MHIIDRIVNSLTRPFVSNPDLDPSLWTVSFGSCRSPLGPGYDVTVRRNSTGTVRKMIVTDTFDVEHDFDKYIHRHKMKILAFDAAKAQHNIVDTGVPSPEQSSSRTKIHYVLVAKDSVSQDADLICGLFDFLSDAEEAAKVANKQTIKHYPNIGTDITYLVYAVQIGAPTLSLCDGHRARVSYSIDSGSEHMIMSRPTTVQDCD